MLPEANYERSVRFSHGLYGAIIITAELVLEQEHTDDALEVIGVLVGTGLVLLLAHSYSGIIARRADGVRHRPREFVKLVVDELPVLTSLVLPLALFTLAELDVITTRTAFRISIWTTIGFLFVIGFLESLRIGRGRLASFALGLIGAAIGVFVILLEVWFS